MKQATETTKLFQQVLETTPKEIAQQVEWSYTIADKIDARLHQLGISQKEFAKRMGNFRSRSLTMDWWWTEFHALYISQNLTRIKYTAHLSNT